MINNNILTYFFLILVIGTFVKNVIIDDENDEGIPNNPNDLEISPSYPNYGKNGRPINAFDYEDAYTPYLESDEFLDLEPEEAKTALGILFELIDLNKNGNISKIELSQWIHKLLEKVDAENSRRKFQELDENKDRNVSINEFLRNVFNHTTKDIEEMSKSKNNEWKVFLNQMAFQVQKFHLADSNNNSLLDLHEFVRFINPLNYKEMALYGLNRTLLLLDKNKDGSIDLNEFLGEYVLDNETEINENRSFKEHDLNGDGILDNEEIRKWTTSGISKAADAEVEYLFSKTDANRDNELSKEEVINQHELWQESQATEYGKKLDEFSPHDEL